MTQSAAAYELAQVNTARLRAPLDSPRLKDFVDALDPVNAVADAHHDRTHQLLRDRIRHIMTTAVVGAAQT